MAQSKLDILLAAKNNASPEIKKLGTDLKGLDDAAKTASGGLGGLSTLAKGAGVAGFVALSAAAAATTVEYAKMGAEGMRLSDAFGTLTAQAGTSADAMLQAMRKASKGMVSDTELIGAANRAMLLGVATDSEKMGKLLEVAGARGKAMGLSLSTAFNDIVTGIGRMSPMILDNLGIVVNQAAANEEYAKSLGKTAAALSDAEKKQALLNAVIASSKDLVAAQGNAAEDAAGKFERFDASVANLKSQLGELVAPGVATFFGAMSDVITIWTGDASQALGVYAGNVKRLKGEVAELEKGLTSQNVVVRLASSALLEGRRAALEFAEAELKAATQTAALAMNTVRASEDFGLMSSAALQARAAIAATGDQADVTGGKLRAMGIDAIAAMGSFNAAMAQSQGIMRAIESTAASSGVLFAQNRGGDAGIARQKEILALGDQQRRTWKDIGHTEEEIVEILMPAYLANLSKADTALFSTAGHTKALAAGIRDAKKEAADLEREFNALQSKAAGVLQGALEHGTGVNPSDFFPRLNDINEDARRLADVAVKGFDSPWASYLNTKFPHLLADAFLGGQDIQAIAAQTLRQFEMGLRPELLDKESAKQRIRMMIAGEESMSALAAELASELAMEMGGVGTAGLRSIVNQALGLKGDEIGAGLSAAKEFAQGAAEGITGSAGNIVKTFAAELRLESNLGTIRDAGSAGGAAWGHGFMSSVEGGVPQELIQMLATLVTPAIRDGLRVDASLVTPP